MFNVIRGRNFGFCKESNAVIIPDNMFTPNFVKETEILENDNYKLVAIQRTAKCQSDFVIYQQLIMTVRNDGGIINKSVGDISELAEESLWWARQIRSLLDFDHHPNNVEIHPMLIGREPLYQSERIIITKSGYELLYTTLFGWCWVELLFAGDVDDLIYDELNMAKNIIKCSA
jgi:hypothetical protein